MVRTWDTWAMAFVLLFVGVAAGACSKDNAVEAKTEDKTYVGKKCASDTECGEGTCVAGKCRSGCTSDATCAPGICIRDGNLSGCRLPDEEECSTSKPCPGGLVCALDKSCRTICGPGVACPESTQVCVAGACVNQTEPGATDTWFSCDTGEKFCSSQDVIACNTVSPGWGKVETCKAPTLCENGECKAPVDAGPEPQPETGPTCDLPNTLCGTLCTNLTTDVQNCGTCANACAASPSHGTSKCVGGQCGVTCESGWGDCNKDAADGCEVDLSSSTANCASCGNVCPATVPNGSSVCEQSKCVVICDADHGNCDTSLSNGCETDIRTDSSHCGDCTTVCSSTLPHAVGACAAKVCGATCDLGWGDCDTDMTNGCETSLIDTNAHCGTCAIACNPGEFCSKGACGPDPHTPVQVSAGSAHSCAVLGSGEISCWGLNNFGQLGNNSAQNSTTPQLVSGITTAAQVAAGGVSTCARLDSGQVMCWGQNAWGQLGVGSNTQSPIPVYVTGISNAVDVDVSQSTFDNGFGPQWPSHACAALSDGTVWCWGHNAQGQLGSNAGTDSNVPVQVPGISDAVEVKVAYTFSCARRSNNHVVCWGANSNGQLGNGSTSSSSPPVDVTGLTDAQEIDVTHASTGGYSCARRQTGAIVCWGATNAIGQQASNIPANVPTAAQVASFAIGFSNLCFRKASDKTVWCWGENTQGQLADGTYIARAAAVRALDVSTGAGMGPTLGVSIGYYDTCALGSDSAVRCSGYNHVGQLGTGERFPSANRNQMVQVPGIGTPHSELGLCADGADNDGDGNPDGLDSDCMTDIASTLGSVIASAGSTNGALGNYYRGSCGGDGRDKVIRWTVPADGDYRFTTAASNASTFVHVYDAATNGFELGCNATTVVATGLVKDQQLFVMLDFPSIDSGGVATLSIENITCQALQGDCDGNTANGCESALDTVQHCGSCSNSCVTGQWCNAGSCQSDTVAQVSAGGAYTLARMTSGLVYGWGSGVYGQLGINSNTNETSPKLVSGIKNAAHVAAGGATSCARLSTGRVQCWGYNAHGQLGTGNNSHSSTPVYVAGITNAVDVDTGNSALGNGADPQWPAHSCAVLSDGTVWCWGYNAQGQLGSNVGVDSTVPIQVPGITDAVEVDVAHTYSCARRSNGHVTCWGNNSNGQLGNGSTGATSGPVEVSSLADAVELDASHSANGGFACARRQTGSIVCWGATAVLGVQSSTTPVAIPGQAAASTFALGTAGICFVRASDKTPWCWGANTTGMLGDGTWVARGAATQPLSVVTETAMGATTNVSQGNNHTCLVTTDGKAHCTGDNQWGPLGDAELFSGASRNRMVPVVDIGPGVSELGRCSDGTDNDGDGKVDGEDPECATSLGSALGTMLASVSPINGALGNYFKGTCGGDGREKVYRWVAPSAGTYLFSVSGSLSIPVIHAYDSAVNGIPFGCSASGLVATLASGQVVYVALDFGTFGPLGNADLTIENITCDAQHGDCDGNTANGCESALDTVQHCGTCANTCVSGQWCNAGSCQADTVAQVVAGGASTLARMTSGLVYAWGSGVYGQLGINSTTNETSPKLVSGIKNALDVAVGGVTACARLSTGRVQCWGHNTWGQLGTGNTSNSSTPVFVAGITNAVDVAISATNLGGGADPQWPIHTCAVLSDGSVWCWGYNAQGQLGSNVGVDSSVPLQVPGITDAVEVATGHTYSCARRSNGHVVCWGANSNGQLGNGSTGATSGPVEVSTLADAVEIDAEHSPNGGLACARRQAGTLVCWGALVPLGQAATTVPTPLPGYTGIGGFSLGGGALCAFESGTGQLWCSGTNTNGLFGSSNIGSSSVPVKAESLLADGLATGVTGVSASLLHMCAIRNQAVLCAGDDTWGGLGDGQRLSGVPRAPLVPVIGPASFPIELGMCADGIDNDADTKTDGLDPDCATDLGTATGADLAVWQVSYAFGNYYSGTCGAEGRERVFLWTAPSAGSYNFSTAGSAVDTVLYVRDVGPAGPELSCKDDAGADTLSLSVAAGHSVAVIVDTKPGVNTGAVHLSIGP